MTKESCLQAGGRPAPAVCVRQRRLPIYAQVQTSPVFCNWCTEGDRWAGEEGFWRWIVGGRVKTETSKTLWTLINKCALSRHKRMEQIKGGLMHLLFRPASSYPCFCVLLDQQSQSKTRRVKSSKHTLKHEWAVSH